MCRVRTGVGSRMCRAQQGWARGCVWLSTGVGSRVCVAQKALLLAQGWVVFCEIPSQRHMSSTVNPSPNTQAHGGSFRTAFLYYSDGLSATHRVWGRAPGPTGTPTLPGPALQRCPCPVGRGPCPPGMWSIDMGEGSTS